jgi:hypothetical protein
MRLLIVYTSQKNGEIRAAQLTLTALDAVLSIIHVHFAIIVESEDFFRAERDADPATFTPTFVDLDFQLLFTLAQVNDLLKNNYKLMITHSHNFAS